jgi:hypothetical protein
MLSIDNFEFEKKDLELLFCIKYYGIVEDISINQEIGFIKSIFFDDDDIVQRNNLIRQIKEKWLNKWSSDTRKLLNVELLNSKVGTVNKTRDLVKSWSREKKNSFFVELLSFSPYFKMNDFADDLYHRQLSSRFQYFSRSLNYQRLVGFLEAEFSFTDGISTLELNKYKYLSFCASCFTENDLATLNLTRNLFDAQCYYDNSLKSISKKVAGSSNTLMWVGLIATAALIVAPYLAGVIGGVMGLSGAAATSAGLALLGGGSLATGGFGMAGGYVAVLAGGAILGYKKGNSDFNGKLESYSANEILLMCAKLATNVYLKFHHSQSSEKKEVVKNICESVRQLQLGSVDVLRAV